MTWDPRDLPSQVGKTVVVTGAGRGIGYFVAEQLAEAGAHVILTTRGDTAALDSIRSRVPGASLDHVTLELGSLESIRRAASTLSGPIDVLINNAGKTGGSRHREVTDDGREIMVGTNAYGPFALTALLLPRITGRVVNLGSLSTRLARADLSDLEQARGRYSLSKAYAYSKHGVHAFTLELDRRLRASSSPVSSLLAHPGFALDGGASPRPGITDRNSAAQRLAERLMPAQGKDHGAWPVVRAAIDPDAAGGQFYGPSRTFFGAPVLTTPVAQSADPAFGAEFWRLAEAATGTPFPV